MMLMLELLVLWAVLSAASGLVLGPLIAHCNPLEALPAT